MASDTIAITGAAGITRPISERLHDWIVTVDHKKLGILYIVYSLVFLVIGGIEATIIRIQLIVGASCKHGLRSRTTSQRAQH